MSCADKRLDLSAQIGEICCAEGREFAECLAFGAWRALRGHCLRSGKCQGGDGGGVGGVWGLCKGQGTNEN